MTQVTKKFTHHFLVTILFTLLLTLSLSTNAQDAGLSGTWTLKYGVDFDDLVKNPTTDLPSTLQILGDRFAMPRGCVVHLQRPPTPPGEVFQSLYKAGATMGDIEAFYQKKLNLKIQGMKAVFRKAPPTDSCYRDIAHLLQIGDTLIASEGGGQFSFLYKRVTSAQGAPGEKPYSQLPFSLTTYHALCPNSISWEKQKPAEATSRCGPLYFPRIAMKNPTDSISAVVGHHNFEGNSVGGQALTNDYSSPVDSGFRPVFHVFAPKGDITLVYVTDVEGSQSRDAMPGAYLSIRNNKVVSQLNSNCTMGLDYICRETDSPVHYVINGKGEFIQQNR